MKALVYNHYAILSVQKAQVTALSVTKREENSRSHPEHGRKDS